MNHTAASGNIGYEILIMPYEPIFKSTPARITEIAVGVSTCASGSHVWNGKIGTLMANPINKAMKARYLIFVPTPPKSELGSIDAGFISVSMLNVCIPVTGSFELKYNAIMEISMKIPPKKV